MIVCTYVCVRVCVCVRMCAWMLSTNDLWMIWNINFTFTDFYLMNMVICIHELPIKRSCNTLYLLCVLRNNPCESVYYACVYNSIDIHMHSSADAYVCVCVYLHLLFSYLYMSIKLLFFWFNLRVTLLGLRSTNINSILWGSCEILMEWYINVFNVSENS